MTRATVLVCSRDRWPDLRRTLESLARVEPPSGVEVSIHLVDNGSNPPLRTFLSGAPALPFPLEVLEEPRPGKSAALNRGLQGLDSDFVAFTDDDMDFEPSWLAAAVEHLRICGCAGVSGPIRLRTEAPLPDWFTPACAALFGATPDTPDGAPLRALPGGNAILRGEAVREAGPFLETLGPRGARAGYSEDVEWSGRLARAGRRLCFCGGAVTFHRIPRRRISRGSLFLRQVRLCRTEVRLDGSQPPGRRRWEDGRLGAEMRGLLGSLLVRKRAFAGFDRGLEIAARIGRVLGLLERRWRR